MSIFFAPERCATPQFVIRMYRPGDGPLLNEAVNASYDHLRRFMPWAKPYTSPDESEALARRFCAHYLTNHDFVLGIFSPDESRLLGGTGYHLRGKALDEHVAEIGMWIRSDVAGQGIGTAALRALLRWGFTDWSWQRIEWHCDAENTASARCAEKAGMKQEAHLRSYRVDHHGNRCDMLIYAMLRDELPPA